ncbi:MFS transporter [Nonomuraea sp. NPDC050556]|uniref:MFS transporter n=1 Tax=Nonomuraea sp. NPDC050556 TaxID=3364369 RepID=UPI003795C4BA
MKHRGVLALLALAQFMLIVDITVVQVALPAIGVDLALDRTSLTWVVTTYTLCFGGLMVFGGRLVDVFGSRRVLTVGLAVFTVASLVCGVAASASVLIAGRALQGVGAALLSPAALATITSLFHGRDRTRALGVWAAIGGTGAALGVLIGGLLTAGPGWSWIFFVNVPVGVAVLLSLPRLLPYGPASTARTALVGHASPHEHEVGAAQGSHDAKDDSVHGLGAAHAAGGGHGTGGGHGAGGDLAHGHGGEHHASPHEVVDALGVSGGPGAGDGHGAVGRLAHGHADGGERVAVGGSARGHRDGGERVAVEGSSRGHGDGGEGEAVDGSAHGHGDRGGRGRVGWRGLDVPGAVAVTAATALLIYGLVAAGDVGWGDLVTLATLGGAVLLYGGFFLIERGASAPLMRASTMVRRPVLSGAFVMLLATGLLLGLFFTSSLYLQHVLRFTALETGLLFLPVAVAITVGAQVGGMLIGRVGGRPVVVGAFLLVAAGAALMTGISVGGNAYVSLLPGFVLAAFGVGPAFVAATTTTMANVPAAEAGVASGVVNTFHELGGSVGVAVVSTVAAASLVPGVVGVGGFISALTACAVAAGVAAVVAVVLVPGGKPAGGFVGHGHGHGH